MEAFLAEDTAFATTLKQSDAMPRMMPALRLSPDAERQLLDDARDRARMKMLVVGGTIALVGLIALVCPAGAMFMVFGG